MPLIRSRLPKSWGPRPTAREWRNVVPHLCAGCGVSVAAPGKGGCGRVPEVSRSSGCGGQLPARGAGAFGPSARLCHARRRRQSQGGLSGFPHAVEGRRSRHPHPHRRQSRVREAGVVLGGIARGNQCLVSQLFVDVVSTPLEASEQTTVSNTVVTQKGTYSRATEFASQHFVGKSTFR